MSTTKQAESTDLVEVDMTELNRWLGVPFGGRQIKEPFVLGDFRRWASRADNFNPLHWDDQWAAESRFGQIVAPQSFTGIRDIGENTFFISQQPLDQFHATDEYFFYGPRVYAGDKFRIDRMLSKLSTTKTRYGPSVFSTVDVTFNSERGYVMKKRATTVQVPRDNAAKLRKTTVGGVQTEEPEWTDEEVAKVEDAKYEYVKTVRTHDKRLFGSVNVGDKLPRCILGPHTGVTIMHTESCDLESAWGMLEIPADQPPPLPAGPRTSPHMQQHILVSPQLDQQRARYMPPRRSDIFLRSNCRGHTYNGWAASRGMPRAYHVGSMLSLWSVDYLANWAGEWGFLRHSTIRFNLPVLSGDITNIDGVVAGVTTGPAGFGTVHVSYRFENQNAVISCTGTGDIELPLA